MIPHQVSKAYWHLLLPCLFYPLKRRHIKSKTTGNKTGDPDKTERTTHLQQEGERGTERERDLLLLIQRWV